MVDLQKPFLVKEDVMELLDYKQSKAKMIIHELNKELEEKGYLTCSARIATKYFCKRFGITR